MIGFVEFAVTGVCDDKGGIGMVKIVGNILVVSFLYLNLDSRLRGNDNAGVYWLPAKGYMPLATIDILHTLLLEGQ